MCRRITWGESVDRLVPAVGVAPFLISFWLLPRFVFKHSPPHTFHRRMSDNEDIDVDSDADKRAHHNALERKRRDHIKDSFSSLRDSVPVLQGEKQSVKQASRAQILDKATDYIQYMRRKNHTHQQDIDDLKKQNAMLEQQVRALEKAKGNTTLQANYSSSDSSWYTNPKGSTVSAFDGGSDSSSESETEEPANRKKLRVEPI
ncbi:protein max isoform X2 [Oncorhynchus tshawytscha]|uniref:protein max isoform X2 n=1 Tax=Oncorhynchus tshawytscha TaxID=74940 RepID=UPI001C3E089D|nr:protein max isoform X2 [Oncorhynchus tshawytscha]